MYGYRYKKKNLERKSHSPHKYHTYTKRDNCKKGKYRNRNTVREKRETDKVRKNRYKRHKQEEIIKKHTHAQN